MRFAIVFFAFAGLFLWAGLAFLPEDGAPLMSLGFFYAALAELCAGLLYFISAAAGINPGPLFKSRQGKLRPWPRFFIWPYLLFEYGMWRRYRKRAREPLFEQAGPGLYLGARLIDEDLAALRQEGITAVLDMVAEFRPPAALADHPDVSYLCLPTLDGASPGKKNLLEAVEFVTDSRSVGRKVLVHCAFGHGRSAVVTAACLIRGGHAGDERAALAALCKLKRRIWLSPEQRKLLKWYAVKRP